MSGSRFLLWLASRTVSSYVGTRPATSASCSRVCGWRPTVLTYVSSHPRSDGVLNENWCGYTYRERHQCQSVPISANPWQSVAININPWQSIKISGNQLQSAARTWWIHILAPNLTPSCTGIAS